MQNVPQPLKRVCIANRGEIVERVCRTANRLGIQTTSVYTEPDKALGSAFLNRTNKSLGPERTGYIDIEKILSVAKSGGCDSIHPGYGFLSENAHFAKRVREEGLVFIGPPQTAIEDMGAKDKSKKIMESAGVPVVPGYHGSNQEPEFLLSKARDITFPVLIKAVLGGGGKGMRIVDNEGEFLEKLESAKSEAQASFGDSRVLIEKYITTPRHIEVQVFADQFGNTVAVGERDCSVQRRHQKVVEESPAPGLDPAVREDLWEKARAAAKAVKYEGAGTVEFIFDNDTDKFYFMEMNTRLQVEHPVSEMVSGEDLVEWQLLVAAGFPLPKTQEQLKFSGHSVEARIYCEDPFNGFMPSSGKIEHLRLPATGSPRIDFSFKEGDTISTLYDPMIGKVIVYGADREEAMRKMRMALDELEIVGPITNVEFIKRIVTHPEFAGNDPKALETGFIPKHEELMERTPIADEVFAQAALATLIADTPTRNTTFRKLSGWSTLGRTVTFEGSDGETVPVLVKEKAGGLGYNIRVGNGASARDLEALSASYFKSSRQLYVSFKDSQAVNSAVLTDGSVHLFAENQHYTLKLARSPWLDKAMGVTDSRHSVVAPMPCTVSRVSASEGQSVSKNQELLVILSMKMETTIRSPRDGVIKAIVAAGDQVKQGTALVEFED